MVYKFFCEYENIKDHSLCGIQAHKKNKGDALFLRFFLNFDLFNDRSVDEAFDANGCVWRKKFNADFYYLMVMDLFGGKDIRMTVRLM